jgi:integrase
MAGVQKENGSWRIRFYHGCGTRHQIRIAGINKATAEKIGRHVDVLNAAKTANDVIDRQTALWLADLGQSIHDKLANVGLVERRVTSRLGEFLDAFMHRRSDVKPGTKLNYERVRVNLLAFFGSDRSLKSITVDDAAAFRLWLQDEQQLSENTLRRRCGRARQFFTAAIKCKLIAENPFDGMPVTVSGNKEKERFITEAESQKILEACPNAEWRLIFSLCRYGGLRCPSEVLALTWNDILWDSSRIIVTSPKTEHHKGHENRVIPLFPELVKPLMEVQEQAAEGTVHVITRYRSANQNLRTELNRNVKRAGLVPWLKPFQNLRSTRETELMESYPAHVVCGWIGNSEAVAKKHYLQITDAHFDRACASKSSDSVAPPVAPQRCEETENHRSINDEDPAEHESSAGSCGSVDDSSHQGNNPARTRTWKIRTKI